MTENHREVNDDNADLWEGRQLGADEAHVRVMAELSPDLEQALDLHPISIRLQKNLIDNLKSLAQLNGLGYQPLIRQILTRWVDCELKMMLNRKVDEQMVKVTAEAPAAAEAPAHAPASKRASARRGAATQRTKQAA